MKVHAVDVDPLKPRDENLPTKVIDVCTMLMLKLDVDVDIYAMLHILSFQSQ